MRGIALFLVFSIPISYTLAVVSTTTDILDISSSTSTIDDSTTDSSHDITKSGISPTTKSILTKIHGLCFIFAWFFCVSVSIFSARYLKDYLSNSTPFGLKIWFHVS